MRNRGQFSKGFIPWMKGRHHSEESNKKNKDAHIGKLAWNKGIKLDRSKVPMMGHFKPHTEEAKIKIGKANFKDGSSIRNIKVICICGKVFYTSKDRLETGRGKCCSSECKYERVSKLLSSVRSYQWKGGISTNKDYWNQRRREDRHKRGICKRYIVKYGGRRIPKKINNQAYRKRVKLAGKLTVKTVQLVYEDNIKKFGTLTCYLCLQSIPFGEDHLEHKIPLSRGGTNEYNNLRIACQKCNCKKNNKTEIEYRREIISYA